MVLEYRNLMAISLTTESFFFNVFILFIFFLSERQSVSGERAEREREGDTESEAGSRLRAVGTEPQVGLELTDHEIMT